MIRVTAVEPQPAPSSDVSTLYLPLAALQPSIIAVMPFPAGPPNAAPS